MAEVGSGKVETDRWLISQPQIDVQAHPVWYYVDSILIRRMGRAWRTHSRMTGWNVSLNLSDGFSNLQEV
jgi:hypothetical protein